MRVIQKMQLLKILLVGLKNKTILDSIDTINILDYQRAIHIDF